MCIAIVKPAGKTLTKELLRICFENNNDGCGFAYINTDYFGIKRIKVYKSMTFEPFYKKYERCARLFPESPFLIHFRIKTHGLKSIENCHPFFVDENTVFIHNGIISGVGFDKDVSDTRLFNAKVLQTLPVGWQYISGVKTLIEDFVGNSKLCVMDLEGKCEIFNESKGSWVDGIWYSNESYKERASYYSQSYAWKAPAAGTVNTKPTHSHNTRSAPINLGTWATCDSCSGNFTLRSLSAYKIDGEYVMVCAGCEKNEEYASILQPSMKVASEEMVNILNGVRNKISGSNVFGPGEGNDRLAGGYVGF